MSILYFNKLSNKICKWNKVDRVSDKTLIPKTIKLGDPLSIQYKRIRILSNKFDWIGDSEVAIINNIRTSQTKEAAPDNIVYYDKSVTPKRSGKNRVMDIDRFDPGEYGNSICYYTPSYQNNDISICTKFYEIDERFGIINAASKLLGLGNTVPNYGVYFSLAGQFLEGIDKILDRLTFKNKLTEDHVIKFDSNDTERPLYYGSYICLPTCEHDDLKHIVENYILDDTDLLNIKDNTLFDKTYFVLELADIRDPSLYDFDFNYNANELLNKLNNRDKVGMNEFLQTNADSYNFKIIQNIISSVDDKSISNSLYNRLSPEYKGWFDKTFPQISSVINSDNL